MTIRAGEGVVALGPAANRAPAVFERPDEVAFFGLLDGCVISGIEGVAKPDRRIFEILLDRYRLRPEGTVFIDDAAANVASIMPAGPQPKLDWSKGFFELAMEQNPKPKSVAIIAADSDFALSAAAGARENAQKAGLKIVYDKTYPPGTPDFTPIVRAIQAENPDLVYVASYPPGSAGMVKAAREVGLKAKMFGGGMVGLQFAGIQKNLGPMLDNIVNYHFWVPAKTLNFPGTNEFLKKYEVAAKGKGVDPLGQYLPPYAYAYMQVLGQAIEATHGMDQAKLAAYIHKHTFSTVVGKVKFGSNGEWARTRVLMTQFRNVKPNDLDQFRKPGTQVVLYPRQWKSGKMVYPFNK